MSRMLLSTTSRGGLVAWKPTSSEHSTALRVPFHCRIVRIESLEPDGIVPIESLEPDGIVPVESLLAGPVVLISALAPDVLMAVA